MVKDRIYTKIIDKDAEDVQEEPIWVGLEKVENF